MSASDKLVALFAPFMLELDDEDFIDDTARMSSEDWLAYMEHRLIGADMPASKPGLIFTRDDIQDEGLAEAA